MQCGHTFSGNNSGAQFNNIHCITSRKYLATEKHPSHGDATLLAWYADAAFHDVGNGIEASDNSNAARTDEQVNCI